MEQGEQGGACGSSLTEATVTRARVVAQSGQTEGEWGASRMT